MLSKARIKFIKSLQLKKYRKQEQCFVVEGGKSVLELLKSNFQVEQFLLTQEFHDQHVTALKSFKGETLVVKPSELDAIGEYSTNNAALAVVRMKANENLVAEKGEFVLMLDDIRDPGNLGTIIRIADWYGVKKIVASEETADVYNNKVIQSSMGSFTRVGIFYTELNSFLEKNVVPVFGAFLDGESVHTTTFGPGGLIIIGNEANGISAGVEKFITRRITIPRFGQAESLNAAVATAIIFDNIRRR